MSTNIIGNVGKYSIGIFGRMIDLLATLENTVFACIFGRMIDLLAALESK
jgi:hypothetical protein